MTAIFTKSNKKSKQENPNYTCCFFAKDPNNKIKYKKSNRELEDKKFTLFILSKTKTLFPKGPSQAPMQ